MEELNNYIICNTKVPSFAATQASVILKDNTNEVVLAQTTANTLQVGKGDWVRLGEN